LRGKVYTSNPFKPIGAIRSLGTAPKSRRFPRHRQDIEDKVILGLVGRIPQAVIEAGNQAKLDVVENCDAEKEQWRDNRKSDDRIGKGADSGENGQQLLDECLHQRRSVGDVYIVWRFSFWALPHADIFPCAGQQAIKKMPDAVSGVGEQVVHFVVLYGVLNALAKTGLDPIPLVLGNFEALA
jgi:hypothetical protein